MLSTRCRVCGSEAISAKARSCDECGALLDVEPRPIAEVVDDEPKRSTRSGGSDANTMQLMTWGAMALAGIATIALLAIAASSVFGPEDAAPTTITTTTTMATTNPDGTPFDLFDYPVTAPVTIVAPRTGETGQYFSNGVVVTFLIGGGDCGGEVMSGVSGTILNGSKAGQTLDYVIGFDLIRAYTGSTMGHVEAEVRSVAPGETVSWSAEGSVGQVVTLRCELTDITVLPAGSL